MSRLLLVFALFISGCSTVTKREKTPSPKPLKPVQELAVSSEKILDEYGNDGLLGKWWGVTDCYRERHDVTLDIRKKTSNGYSGQLRIHGAEYAGGIGREHAKKPVRISVSPNGRYSIKEQQFAKILKSRMDVVEREGGSVIKLTTSQRCTSMSLYRFNSIPDTNMSNDADVCWQAYMWFSLGKDELKKATNIRRKYPNVLGSLNDRSMLEHILFDDTHFKRLYRGRPSRMSVKSIGMHLDQIDICLSYSNRRNQITNIFGYNPVSNLSASNIKKFNESNKNRDRAFDAIIVKAKGMEDSLDNVQPFQKLLNSYVSNFSGLPENKYFDALDALSERAAGMQNMAILAEKHGLKKIPLLPQSSSRAGDVTPNDATLPRATEDDLVEQSKPLDINIDCPIGADCVE